MKFLITGDLHLRGSSPENRIDDFFESQINKMEQIFKLATENKCEMILCPGDVFDNPRPSFDVLEYYIKLFKKYNTNCDGGIQFLTVWGQHDQRFRTKERTALKLMDSLGYMKTIDGYTSLNSMCGIDLYGCSYGDEILIPKHDDLFNILLIHKTILDKQKWIGQEDYLLSDKVFKKYPYDLIISGDWHHPVFYQYKKQTILNCGCLVRKTVAEADLIPHIYILDINEEDLTYSLKKIELLYEPAEKVFREEALNRETVKENAKLQEFIESIKNNEISTSLDFKKNLETMMKNSSKEVKDIILKSLGEINE